MKRQYVVRISWFMEGIGHATVVYGKGGTVNAVANPFDTKEEALDFIKTKIKKVEKDKRCRVEKVGIFERFVNPWINAESGEWCWRF